MLVKFNRLVIHWCSNLPDKTIYCWLEYLKLTNHPQKNPSVSVAYNQYTNTAAKNKLG